ncbi:hypothetical protein Vafri_9033 [Volvox africanus]|uniref:Endonuclease V n=2 Tax=Volvox africanus TaxID=51714 RepID=A0A8J4B3N5_9CHLO|nr:hypothetical protein Vafri_9033 [Volvox africanus]
MAEWARQQQDMAKQVITTDEVPWHLNADRPTERLTRVGGLDISFLEPQCCPRGQQHSPLAHNNGAPAPAVDTAASSSTTEIAIAATTTTTTITGTSPSSSMITISENEPGASAGALSSSGAQPTQWWDDQRDPAEDSEQRSASCGPSVAALVVLSFPDMRVLYEDYEPVDLSIPYLPGYLGFRECDAYGRLLKRVQASANQPQVLLVDGCGVLHPRRCGSACQVGGVRPLRAAPWTQKHIQIADAHVVKRGTPLLCRHHLPTAQYALAMEIGQSKTSPA